MTKKLILLFGLLAALAFGQSNTLTTTTLSAAVAQLDNPPDF